MAECGFVKPDGTPCRRIVRPSQDYCYSHDPARAAERARNAAAGGRLSGNREVRDLKAEIKALIAETKAGERDRLDTQVLVQAYRALKDYIELERRIKETDELRTEVERLKSVYGVH